MMDSFGYMNWNNARCNHMSWSTLPDDARTYKHQKAHHYRMDRDVAEMLGECTRKGHESAQRERPELELSGGPS